MSKKSSYDEDMNDNDDNLVPPKHISSSSSRSSYSIEVCQGPDCKGLGGGIAILEIEELVQEHKYHNTEGNIRVVSGGCRDFCSVGPNVHVLQK